MRRRSTSSRGFHIPLGRKMVKLWKRVILQRCQKNPNNTHSTRSGYSRLKNPNKEASGATGCTMKNKTMTKICYWGRCLRKRLCQAAPNVAKADSASASASAAPKGHLAVYVGEKEDDTQRYMVPVIYFNHPLFSQLLREAEDEFGFEHPGGITIPCRVAEFESVQTRIAGERGRHLTRRIRFT